MQDFNLNIFRDLKSGGAKLANQAKSRINGFQAGTAKPTVQAEPDQGYLSFSSPAKQPILEMEMPRPKKLSPLQSLGYILAMLLVLLVTFSLIFRFYDRSMVQTYLSSANYFLLFISLALVFAMQIAFGLVLLSLTGQSSGQKYPFMLGLNTAMIGFFFNNITPSSSGGQPMEIYYLYRCGVRIANASLSFVALSLFYYLSKLILGLLALITSPKMAWAALSGYRGFFILGCLAPIILSCICFLLLFKPQIVASISQSGLEFLIRKRIIKRRQSSRHKLNHWLDQYHGGSAFLRQNLKLLIKNFAYYFLGSLSFYSSSYFCALAIGARPNYFLFMKLQSLYFLTSTALPTPGSVGLSESSFAKIFSYCLKPEEAVATMILSRTVSLYLFIFIALAFAIYAFASAGRGQYRIKSVK